MKPVARFDKLAAPQQTDGRAQKSQLLSRLFRSKAAVISVFVLLLVLVAALAAPWVAPNDPSPSS